MGRVISFAEIKVSLTLPAGLCEHVLTVLEGGCMKGVMVFTATKAKEREGLGERITDWLRSTPQKKIEDVKVTQSSDEEFHCLTITILYEEKDDS